MLLTLANDGLSTWSGEVLAVGLFKDQPATELDSRWPGLANTLKREQFSGKPGQQLVLNLLDFLAQGSWMLLIMDAGIFVLTAWLILEAATALNRQRRSA